MMHKGRGALKRPLPRTACVSIADGFTIAASSSPRATACARIGEPHDMRSHGLYVAPEPLPMLMQMSRLPVYGVAGLPAMCRPISQRNLARMKFAPFGRYSMTLPKFGWEARD